MIVVTMSVGIQAERSRVWRALVRPDETAGWHPTRPAVVQLPARWPVPGSAARWRGHLGGVQLVWREEPLEVVPEARLRSVWHLALARLDQTWTLAPDGDARVYTRVALRLSLPNAIPVVGGEMDRFGVRKLGQELVDDSLRGLRAWCEKETVPS